MFLLNAIVYFFDWFFDEEEERKFDIACWAHLCNILASALFVVSSSLFFFFPDVDSKGALAKEHATVQAALNFSAVFLFALDGFMFNSSYGNKRIDMSKTEKEDQPVLKDPKFYEEMLNTVPSLGYFGTGVAKLFSLLDTDLKLEDVR